MAVRIRLRRTGRKKVPTYRVIVADSRSPRDGRFIDVLGRYDPRPDPSLVEIDNEKSVRWLMNGAKPSDAARKLLEISGALEEFEKARGKVTAPTKKKPSGGASGSKKPAGAAKKKSTPKSEDAAKEK